ncbi:MAG: glycosyltransferase family 1 protein [Nitrospirae bacterium]|nr:glycosyltransferase family 1 protein [Candidatus Manganitrophaceae bacterium]
MKILFITTDVEDYLSDALLHGLRQLFAQDVIDFPKKHCMYKTFPSSQQIYGNGFTLYRTLEDIPLDRTQTFEQVKKGIFDLIVFSDIYRQYGYLTQLLPYLKKENTIVCDGEDTSAIFPYRSSFYKNPYYATLPKPHKKFLYYKREWTQKTIQKRWFNLLPSTPFEKILTPENLRPISFSIPKEKIMSHLPNKKNLFPKHIVDQEISEKINGNLKYPFKNESDYYADLQSSRFGITTKRGGWDCLRHYEIAANGAVICFKDLDKKPKTCAPHGLNHENSIAYRDYKDLIGKINLLSDKKYKHLQEKSMQWILQNTTVSKAKQLIRDFDALQH